MYVYKFITWCLIGFFLLGVVKAAEDTERTASAAVSDEDEALSEDATVDSGEEKAADIKSDSTAVSTEGSSVNSDGRPGPSKEADASLLFVNPSLGVRTGGVGVELPVNKKVDILVSFTNLNEEGKEGKDFTVEVLDAAIRYPQDFSYYIQNFTSARLSRMVEPQREASFAYSFVPAQQLAGRPFGLTIRLGYRDQQENIFNHYVFNDTITLVENDEGFDTEGFFMWVLIAAILVLVLFGLYHVAKTYGLKKLKRGGQQSGKSANGGAPVEMGTGGGKLANVNLDWIPSDHLKLRQSPNMSPRKRKTRRDDGNTSN